MRACLMRRLVLGVALISGALLATTTARADTLTTALPNNGSGGVFFNLTASGGTSLTFDSFGAPFAGAVGVTANIEVWSRPGSYVGFTGSSAGWTLLGTVTGTAAGTSTFSAPINLPSPVAIGAGTTIGFYIHSITANNGLRYTGTAATPPQQTWSDSYITLFGDTARTGNVSFGGTAFSPRTFSGFINYTPAAVPEPTTLALCGLGLAGSVAGSWRLKRRRRGSSRFAGK